MSVLTSLLVRDQVVPVRTIEEAIQQHVISGGALETVLLEMGGLPEDVLNAYCAATCGLLPVTREEIMHVSRDAIRMVPRDVASRHRMVPLAVEGRTLIVALAAPLSAEDEQQLSFLLGSQLVQRIVNEPRLALALAHYYDIEIEPRIRRLGDKLRDRDPGVVPYVAPPPPQNLADRRRSDIPRKSVRALAMDDDDGPDTAPLKTIPSPPLWRDTAVTEKIEVPSIKSSMPPPPEEALAAIGRALKAARAPGTPSSKPPASGLKKLRGPLHAKHAVDLIGEAEDRDAILDVFFAFARQFFDYTALFSVQGDVAEGRDAYGPGADPEQVRGIAIPLEVPSAFAEARRAGGPRMARLRKDTDHRVATQLGRANAQPALILPVSVRGRVVLVLYGDRDGEQFELADVPELLAFVPRVGEAFERLILKRKQRGYSGGEKGGTGKAPAGAAEAKPRASRAGAAAWRAPSGSTRRDTIPEPAPIDRESDPPVEMPGPEVDEAPSGPRRVFGMPVAELLPDGTSASTAGRSKKDAPQARPRAALARPGMLDVLGVPRSAPPPPTASDGDEPAAQPEAVHAAPDPTDAPSAAADLRDAAIDDVVPGPEILEAPPAEPEPVVPGARTSGDDGDDRRDDGGEEDDDVEVAADGGEVEGAPASESKETGAGEYRVHDAGEDVVASARRKPKKKRRGRAEARRDEPKDLMTDVVRVGPDTPTATASPPPPQPAEPARQTRKIRPAPDEPTVIVDMGENVEQLVDDLMQCGPEDEGAALQALLGVGEPALPVLVQHFPGPLWFDRHQPHRRLPRGRDVSAIARALVAFRDRAAPYLVTALDGREADVRFYATLVASELLHPVLLPALGRRVFDSDQGTRTLSLDVIRLYRGYDRELEPIVKEIRVAARIAGKDPVKRRIAVRALGELRDARAIELLIELIDDDDEELSRESLRSLVLITRQDLGTSQRKWTQWVERNGANHRIEWLIDALLHDDEKMRAAAGEELKQITQQYYGYHPSLPKRDREVAQRKYREWWATEGQHRFRS